MTNTSHSKTKHYTFTNKKSSLVSVDQQQDTSSTDDVLITEKEDENNDLIGKLFNSSTSLDHRSTIVHERQCSITQMLLVYAQQEMETLSNSKQSTAEHSLNNIFNALELHFNTYANDQQQIYFEGIFQILHDFKEQITEFVLTETMQLLQMDPLAPCTFENFILILCHLPPIRQECHAFLNVFNELDHNKDSYITLEDLQFVLPNLTSHLDEEVISAAIRAIDVDHDDEHLSYFDFVTSLLALEECKSIMKTKTSTNDSSETNTEQKKEYSF